MASRIVDIGQSLLAAVIAALDSPPTRQVFTVGEFSEPLENDEVAVAFLRAFRGTPGLEDPTASFEYSETVLEFRVRIVRCVPTSTQRADTPASVLGDAALVLAGDIDAVIPALWAWRPPDDDSSGQRWVGPIVATRASGRAHTAGFLVQATR